MINKRIVIIDDIEELTETFKMMLECYFEDVIDFNNPEKALDYLLKNQKDIDFIISDINMPVLNGIELFKRYRKVNNETPFIFYSGHAEFDEQLNKLKEQYRLDDVISKPNINIVDIIQEYFS